jgi:nitrate/nitrite transporter NarK
MIFFAVFALALAVYCIYVAYLVWFRFSPLAVRHICGAVGVYILTLLWDVFKRSRDADWMPFAFLGSFFVIYIVYRVASHRLSRWLFPETSSGVQNHEILTR